MKNSSILPTLCIIACVLIIVFITPYYKYHNRNNKSGFSNKVYIFYAPWCGHCKKSMGEFTKASEDPDTDIELIDTTKDTNKELMEKYDVKGFPTIMRSDGKKYTGPRKADSIIKFASGG
jgi:thiol-disulfide isomerase/thioredoxin